MPKITIDTDLAELALQLSLLRESMPVNDPDYPQITLFYHLASDSAQVMLGEEIDSASEDYVEFTKHAKNAVAAIQDAQKQIDTVAKVIVIMSKVAEVIEKLASKLH